MVLGQPDIGMLPHLDHAGREDALRAIQCREGLRELCHVTADGGLLLHQDDLVAAVGDVQRGLHPADSGTDHQSPIIHSQFPNEQ